MSCLVSGLRLVPITYGLVAKNPWRASFNSWKWCLARSTLASTPSNRLPTAPLHQATSQPPRMRREQRVSLFPHRMCSCPRLLESPRIQRPKRTSPQLQFVVGQALSSDACGHGDHAPKVIQVAVVERERAVGVLRGAVSDRCPSRHACRGSRTTQSSSCERQPLTYSPIPWLTALSSYSAPSLRYTTAWSV